MTDPAEPHALGRKRNATRRRLIDAASPAASHARAKIVTFVSSPTRRSGSCASVRAFVIDPSGPTIEQMIDDGLHELAGLYAALEADDPRS